MPLYFFDFDDGDGAPSAPDRMGTDLPSLASVPEEAVAVLASIAKDRLPDGSHRVFSASVRNEEGRVVLNSVDTAASRSEDNSGSVAQHETNRALGAKGCPHGAHAVEAGRSPRKTASVRATPQAGRQPDR